MRRSLDNIRLFASLLLARSIRTREVAEMQGLIFCPGAGKELSTNARTNGLHEAYFILRI
jgi:hypothetical protein